MTVQDIGPAPDWCVQDHGTIVTFAPLTQDAIVHGDERFPEDCPMLGENYCVEQRYAIAIIHALMEHGFVVALNGRIIENNQH